MAMLYRLPTAPSASPGYLRSNNYPGSSGYVSTINPPDATTPAYDDFPELGTSGVIVWHKTQKPVTGTYGGTTYKAGQIVDPTTGRTTSEQQKFVQDTQNDPTKRYKPVDVVKSPDIAQAENDLMAQFKKTADSSLTDFNQHLKNFNQLTDEAVKKGEAATDTAPFENRMRGYQADYSKNLDSATGRYDQALSDSAASENAIVKKAQDILPQYDEAAQAAADRQQQALMAQISRYKIGTGTARSLGSDELRMAAQGAADIQLPVQLAKVGRRYDILNNLELPVSRDITGREIQFSGSYLPSVAGQKYTSGTGVESAIQQLKMQVAGMSYENAARYMQSLGIPAAVQQSILSGEIGNVAGLGQLEEGSRYRGLQDVLGVNVSQPQYYSVATGAPPVYPTRTGNGNYFSGAGNTVNVAPASENPNGMAPVGQGPLLGTPQFGVPRYSAPPPPPTSYGRYALPGYYDDANVPADTMYA